MLLQSVYQDGGTEIGSLIIISGASTLGPLLGGGARSEYETFPLFHSGGKKWT